MMVSEPCRWLCMWGSHQCVFVVCLHLYVFMHVLPVFYVSELQLQSIHTSFNALGYSVVLFHFMQAAPNAPCGMEAFYVKCSGGN